ncbi:MAG: hypothetical protein JJU00_01380 [Opitutales bacterium]|nr:hypothetical protein [Opitutales bacterium]
MNTPERMRRVRMVTTKDCASAAAAALQRAGVLDVEKGPGPEDTDRAAVEKERSAVAELIAVIDGALAYVPQEERVPIARDVDADLMRSVSEIEKETRELCAGLTAMHSRLEKLQTEEREARILCTVARELSDRIQLPADVFSFSGKVLCSGMFVLPGESSTAVAARLEELALVVETVDLDGETALLVVCRRSQWRSVNELLSSGGRLLHVVTDSGEALFSEGPERRAADLGRERENLLAEIRERTNEHLEHLVLLREALAAESDRLGLLQMALATDHAVLIEGWAPQASLEATVEALRGEVTPLHIESRPPRAEDQPPTKLRNAALLQPFEIIVNLFATPRYHEWDPTPLVAYFFALFFGIMLGDAVYGVLLLLLARFLLPKMAEDPTAEGFLMFRRVITVCAVCAIAVGLLTGTYLGDVPAHFFGLTGIALSEGLHSLYMNPMAFIVASLVVGIVHVNLGHLLMLLRGLRERKAHAVLGRSGVFVIQITGIPLVLAMLGTAWFQPAETTRLLLLAFLLAGVLMVVAASLMEKGWFLGSILWIFDLSGILGDIMSYARLAGVGLATFFLAHSFNMMATLVAGMLPEGIVRLTLGSLVMLVILVFGHALNLLLSSITCFVHSLRLCFVEFLFKFYEGGGRPYAPFRLRRRAMIPVRAGSGAFV